MSEFARFDRQDITTAFLGDGMRYWLPHRRLGRLRHLGWVVGGCGLFVTLFMMAWVSGPILGSVDDLNRGEGVDWFSVAFGCLGLFGLIPGLGMLVGGMAILSGRTRAEVIVRNGSVTVKEWFFLVRLRRHCASSKIQRLRVAASGERASENQFDATTWLGDSDSALIAETDGGKEFPIAIAYPQDLLVRLAPELAPRLEADWSTTGGTIELGSRPTATSAQIPHKIEVVEGPISQDPEEVSTIPPPPVDSRVTIQRRPYGITIEIPPVGLWRGSKGLFLFALLWNAFISVFIVVGVLATVGVIEMEGDGPPWSMLVIMIPFAAVGAGLTIGAVNMGRRHATIATEEDLVMIVRHSIFGKTTREFSASQIELICCGNSGMEVNGVPVKQLQIIPANDKKLGCLSQLNEDELQWIAAELNQALGVRHASVRHNIESPALNRDESGLPFPMRDSRITVDRSSGSMCIHVPPKGLFRYAGLVLFGVVFAAIGIGISVGVGFNALGDGFDRGDLGMLMLASIFLLTFGGAGGIATLIGLVAGRRQFRLTVEHQQLSLLRRGPFGRKLFYWHRDDLQPIAVVDSGTQVNDRRLYQVMLRSRKGPSVGIMTGHGRADLDLVAGAVNHSLGLTQHDPLRA